MEKKEGTARAPQGSGHRIQRRSARAIRRGSCATLSRSEEEADPLIIDLGKFVRDEEPFWKEMERILVRIENDPAFRMTPADLERFLYLYERASVALTRLTEIRLQQELRLRLERLVARAYSAIHQTRQSVRFRPLKWVVRDLPRAFRRHFVAFLVAAGISAIGAAAGGAILLLEPNAKDVLLPFGHLHGDPRERVEMEERDAGGSVEPIESRFAAALMQNNIRVSITALALGMTWGIGTAILLFYNGVILGAVCLDYVMAGETVFLVGWLLPHGIIEIPAIFVGGQAAFLIARAIIGHGDRRTLDARFREIMPDVASLAGLFTLMLIWAGIIESFFSQYHEPVLPYAFKIAFGVFEGIAFAAYLAFCGRKRSAEDASANPREKFAGELAPKAGKRR